MVLNQTIHRTTIECDPVSAWTARLIARSLRVNSEGWQHRRILQPISIYSIKSNLYGEKMQQLFDSRPFDVLRSLSSPPPSPDTREPSPTGQTSRGTLATRYFDRIYVRSIAHRRCRFGPKFTHFKEKNFFALSGVDSNSFCCANRIFYT